MGRAVWRTALPRTFAESEEEERKQYANQVGTDGWLLLDAACGSCHAGLDEDAARYHYTAHHLGATV